MNSVERLTVQGPGRRFADRMPQTDRRDRGGAAPASGGRRGFSVFQPCTEQVCGGSHCRVPAVFPSPVAGLFLFGFRAVDVGTGLCGLTALHKNSCLPQENPRGASLRGDDPPFFPGVTDSCRRSLRRRLAVRFKAAVFREGGGCLGFFDLGVRAENRGGAIVWDPSSSKDRGIGQSLPKTWRFSLKNLISGRSFSFG